MGVSRFPSSEGCLISLPRCSKPETRHENVRLVERALLRRHSGLTAPNLGLSAPIQSALCPIQGMRNSGHSKLIELGLSQKPSTRLTDCKGGEQQLSGLFLGL